MSRPNALTSAAVVRAAIQLADERGIDAVTMRGLGAQVGVGAMALYNYVTGRDALLDAMVAHLLNQLVPQLRPTASRSTAGAVDYLERTARVIRSLAIAHPWLIRLMVTRPPLGPTLNAPLAVPAALACTDAVLTVLARHHVDDAASIRTFRAFCAFLLGHLLLEIPFPPGPVALPNRRQTPLLSPTRRAQLLGRLTPLANTEPVAEFDRSLHVFLGSIEHGHHSERRGQGLAVPIAADPTIMQQGTQP